MAKTIEYFCKVQKNGWMLNIRVKSTIISDINPTSIGGIINADDRVIYFKYNAVFNVLSSTSATCFYVTKSKISIENSCFSRCAAFGGNEAYGNIGRIQNSNVKINEFSSFHCPFSTSYAGDSLFYFASCGASFKHFNSSFNIGGDGSPVFRSGSNISDYEVKFLTCSSCVDWAFLECYQIIECEKCAFINSTLVTDCMICASQGSLFDTCYFFQMTQAKPKFKNSVTLRNCCSDVEISGYSLTINSNINNVALPLLNKPSCRGIIILYSCKKHSRNSISFAFLITLMILR